MKYTDDSPSMLPEITPSAPSLGPIFLSLHSRYGFNVRHFYQHWQSGDWKATKKGISVIPADALPLVEAMVGFINENEIYPGRKFRVIEYTEEVTDLDEPL